MGTVTLQNDSRTAVGERAEGIVMTRLMSLGAVALLPLSTARYDFAVDMGGDIEKVQVKVAQRRDSSISFNTYSQPDGSTVVPYTEDEVDVFAAYYPGTDKVYWIPFDEAADTLTNLSLQDPSDYTKKQRRRMRFAVDHELEAVFGGSAWD